MPDGVNPGGGDEGLLANSRPLAIIGQGTAGPIYEVPKPGEGIFVGSDGRLYLSPALARPSPQPSAAVRCAHEAYHGQCVHCGVKIVNGIAALAQADGVGVSQPAGEGQA